MSETDNTTETTVTANTTEELPEWARKKISEANGEAAKYRVKAQTAVDDARKELEAKFQADFQLVSDEKSAALVERDSAVSNLSKLEVALQAGIPGESALEFSKLLQGSSVEDYTTHAEALKKMFGTSSKVRAIDPTQGLGNGTTDDGDALQQLSNSHLKR